MNSTSPLRTLCFIETRTHLLLGLKKRGFGQGRWNGFGGKLEAGESVEAAARREVQEEAGVIVGRLEQRGVLNFTFADTPASPLEVHVFSASDFSGEPVEAEEMRPQWFEKTAIPYDQMWPDDVYWLPLLLEGKTFEGRFHFADTNVMLSHEIVETRL